jgi:glycosyltransferase involved in cell wall biosynthesis
MHIALLTNGLFPWVVGGMQKHSANLMREWAGMGIDVDVYFTEEGPYQVGDRLPADLLSCGLPGRTRFYGCRRSRLPYFPLHHYADCYVESCRIAEQFAKESRKVDFIYAQGFTGYRLIQMKRQGIPLPSIGANLHGLEALQQINIGPQERLLKFVSRPMHRWILQAADVILSLGGRLDELILRAAPKAKILRSGNGIAHEWITDSVTQNSGPRRFIFVGRYTRRKGLQFLYEAIRGISTGPSFELHVVGDIPNSCRVADPRLVYHGPINGEERLRKLMRTMHVLVCPSLAEGVPTVVLEGMASGLAIIATDVGATASLLTQQTGWLIEAGNALVLRKTLLKALALDEPELLRIRQAGVDRAWDFEWRRVAEHTLKEISDFINRKQRMAA